MNGLIALGAWIAVLALAGYLGHRWRHPRPRRPVRSLPPPTAAEVEEVIRGMEEHVRRQKGKP